jgi:hypothetical protein
VLLGLIVGVVFLVRARGRRQDWDQRLSAATVEVAWFARELIPQLQQQPSAEMVAGGWQVAQGRVVAVEDNLTGLESTAPDETATAKARTLRDAVRTARGRLDGLTQQFHPTDFRTELALAVTELNAAIAAVTEPQPGPEN